MADIDRRPGSDSDGPLSAGSASGDVGDQGDLAMGANRVRDQYGVDGSGIQIGVMSDSFNAMGGADEDVAAGRLPAGVMVLSDLPEGTGDDEGRAMMQLIHKVAPGAELAFHDWEGGTAEFAVKVLELAGCPGELPASVICNPTAGLAAKVIVDDLGIMNGEMSISCFRGW